MPKRNIILIIAIALVCVATLLVTRSNPPLTPTGQPVSKFYPVIEAFNKIRDSYYPIPSQEQLLHGRVPATAPSEQLLLQAAARGMIEELHDPYSRYVAPGQVSQFDDLVMGNARGLGLKVEIADGKLTVIGAIPGSPAQRSGLLRGDRIVSINGLAVAGKTVAQVTRLLDDGPPGSEVAISYRPGLSDAPPSTVTLRREEFPVESVQGFLRDSQGEWVYMILPAERIAYIRIKEFVPETLDRLQQVLLSHPSLHGLVLDLRDNPGGEFKSSLGVADQFLSHGTIVTVMSRSLPPQRFPAHEKSGSVDVPLVVLVNSHSASGAEIVAGSLKINDRAVLVGTRTRGKGCVQRIINLGKDIGQISLTTSEYYVGDDEPIARRPDSDKWGVDPHVEVTLSEAAQDELARLRLDVELAPPPVATRPAATAPATEPIDRLLARDAQLRTAVRLLLDPKGMADTLKLAARARQMSRDAATQRAVSGED